jgi:PhnB protein
LQLYPHLTFDGQCETAFKFYEDCLHGKTTFMLTYENSPMAQQTPPEWRKKICHATYALGDFMFSGADPGPGHYQKPQGFGLQFNINDAAEAERIFQALAKNGTVQMPTQETFWATRFGTLVDQFGIPWMINCGKPA